MRHLNGRWKFILTYLEDGIYDDNGFSSTWIYTLKKNIKDVYNALLDSLDTYVHVYVNDMELLITIFCQGYFFSPWETPIFNLQINFKIDKHKDKKHEILMNSNTNKREIGFFLLDFLVWEAFAQLIVV